MQCALPGRQAGLARQRLFNRGHQLSIQRRHPAREAGDQLSIPPHQVFVEIPFRRLAAGAGQLRMQRVQELLDRFSRLPWPEGVTGKELQDALYDEHGLPV